MTHRHRAAREDAREGLRRAVDPAQGGQAPRPGAGHVLRRRAPARDGLRPLRPLAVRAREDRLDRRLQGARARRACTGRSPATRSRSTTDPFFEMSVEPGGNIKDYALAVGRVRHMGEPVAAVCAATRELARDAAELVEVAYDPLPVLVDAEESLKDEVVLHDDAGSNVVWSGVFDWGDVDRGARRGRPRREDRPPPLPPLLVDAARVRGRARRVRPGHRGVDAPLQPPDAGRSARSGWRRRSAVGIDKLRFVTHDIGGGFGNKICLHPQYVVLCLLARKLGRPVQWTEWRTDQHTANAHGNERTFLDVEVAREGRRRDDRLQGARARRLRRVPALRAARLHHLGAGDARDVRLAEHPRSTSRRSARTSRRCRRTAATRGCSTCG